jgi:hypothetical protein
MSQRDTGQVPSIENNNENFVNVSVGNNDLGNNVSPLATAANTVTPLGTVANTVTPLANANNTLVPETGMGNNLADDANENLATSEMVSTEPFATAEPSMLSMPSVKTTKTGKPLSAKQTDLQRLRSETLADMREKYAERFSGYNKPPKAKAYHAAGLTTVRQRDGEAAYIAALNDIMDKNDSKLGTNGKSTFAATRRAKKPVMNTARSIIPSINMTVKNARLNTAANRDATNRAISSIEDMGRTAKGIIDTIVQASKDMSRELGKSGNTTALNQLSKSMKVKKPKKSKAPLSTVYEGNNSTRRNSMVRNNSTPLNLM